MKLFGHSEIKNNTLEIGGIPVPELTKQYGTPLYVMDESGIENQLSTFTKYFNSSTFETRILYAGKAFLNIYMVEILKEHNMYLDVVSGGELYTAIKANFDMQYIYFHGNAKTYNELKMAVEYNVGTIVLDHPYEYKMLSSILKEKGKTQRVLVRVNPAVETDTHKYIQTSNDDSKFGMTMYTQETDNFIKLLTEDHNIIFAGLHCHIGSQIFDKESYFEEAEKMADFFKKINNEFDIKLEELNLGGGFGVYYTEGDQPLELTSFLIEYSQTLEKIFKEKNISPLVLSIEPGRSLINNFGTMLYKVSAIKKGNDQFDFILVDGGMNDNMRPQLYEAKYTAAIGNKMNEENNYTYRIAGKLCEGGDVLIDNIKLPKVEREDLVVIPSTGAYTYSMASNYNRLLKSAVVFVKNGNAKLAVKRETFDDLIRNDVKRNG